MICTNKEFWEPNKLPASRTRTGLVTGADSSERPPMSQRLVLVRATGPGSCPLWRLCIQSSRRCRLDSVALQVIKLSHCENPPGSVRSCALQGGRKVKRFIRQRILTYTLGAQLIEEMGSEMEVDVENGRMFVGVAGRLVTRYLRGETKEHGRV